MASRLAVVDKVPEQTDGLTLLEASKRLELAGYEAQMAATDGGKVLCYACRSASPAGEMKLDSLDRTEGVSDPDDMLAIAALQCPNCGAKGIVTLNYGPESTIEEAEVLRHFGDTSTEP